MSGENEENERRRRDKEAEAGGQEGDGKVMNLRTSSLALEELNVRAIRRV